MAGLETFDSPEAFKQYLADQVGARQPAPWDFFDLVGLDMLPPAAMEAGAGGATGDDYSTTNLQEAGVDESDVVKNDAAYLYVLSGRSEQQGRLRIIRAVPAGDMAILSTFNLPAAPLSLYLKGDKAVALGRDYRGTTTVTAVTILNVADRAAPVLEATVEFEASLVTSRLIGASLHLVLQTQPTFAWDADGASILAADPDDLIPDLSVNFPDGRQVSRDLVEWQDFYHPIEPDGYQVTAVVTVDLDDPQLPVRSKGVLADAGSVYASTEALYLTDNDYDYSGLVRESTDIYKFAFADSGAVLVGTGTIPGRLLNRFSLGEYKGYLRTATTIGHVSRGGSDATNNVYVLGREGNELRIVGRIEQIAPGEQIYAARFIGDRGFLVTFKKVDPLFTLDLSDPAAPRVLGSLKVPGYSDYIHPLGENHLLTIGKDAVDMGDFAWYQGVQLSVFDVTDFSDPRQVDAQIIGDRGTESEALGDPHAFNYFEPAQMLAVPMNISEGAGPDPSDYGDPAFEGLCLFQVIADEGIEPVGRISTAQGAPSYYASGWTRGIFMSDYVYAVTESLVQAVPLADLDAAPIQLPLE